jgi:phosphohistidine phosphatase SixA
MKTYITALAMVATSVFVACNKEDASTGTPGLTVTGIPDTLIADTLGSYVIYTNTAATFSLNAGAAGTIDSSGRFTAGNVDGVYTLNIRNSTNPNDVVSKTIVVSKFAPLFNNMKQNGGYLLSFRHAPAATGIDQVNSSVSEWWKSCDSNLARQLTVNIGPQQADTTGFALRLLGFQFDTIMSSVFCRAKQTAEHFNLGLPIREYESISMVYDEPNRYANTMNLYASKPLTNLNYLAVTHAGYAVVPSPAPLAGLFMGDCAVFKINGPGIAPTYITTIRLNDWLSMGRRS